MSGILSRRETTDGSRPRASHLSAQIAAKLPIGAFALLRGGDLFDAGGRGGGSDLELAAQVARDRLSFADTNPEAERRIVGDLTRQLAGNPVLARRLAAAKPIAVDVVSDGRELLRRGYPRTVARAAAGIFWDRPEWPSARVALRLDALARPAERTLVFHEMAHALHALAMSEKERELIARALRPVFGHPADQDEVFAIYSERELIGAEPFSKLENSAPGIYGYCRRQWCCYSYSYYLY